MSRLLLIVLTLCLVVSASTAANEDGKSLTFFGGGAIMANINEEFVTIDDEEYGASGFYGGIELNAYTTIEHFSFLFSMQMSSTNDDYAPVSPEDNWIFHNSETVDDKYTNYKNFTFLAGVKINSKIMYLSGQIGYDLFYHPSISKTFVSSFSTGDSERIQTSNSDIGISKSPGFVFAGGINLTSWLSLGVRYMWFDQHKVDWTFEKIYPSDNIDVIIEEQEFDYKLVTIMFCVGISF
jgi:hypothetical protein